MELYNVLNRELQITVLRKPELQENPESKSMQSRKQCMNRMRKSAKREKLLKKNQKEVLELKDSEKEMQSAQRAPPAEQTTQKKGL